MYLVAAQKKYVLTKGCPTKLIINLSKYYLINICVLSIIQQSKIQWFTKPVLLCLTEKSIHFTENPGELIDLCTYGPRSSNSNISYLSLSISGCYVSFDLRQTSSPTVIAKIPGLTLTAQSWVTCSPLTHASQTTKIQKLKKKAKQVPEKKTSALLL